MALPLGTVSTGGPLLVVAGIAQAHHLVVVAVSPAALLGISATTLRPIAVPPAGDQPNHDTSPPQGRHRFRIPCFHFLCPRPLQIASGGSEGNAQFLRRPINYSRKPKRKRRSSTLTYSSSALFVSILYFCTSLQLRPGCPSCQECRITRSFSRIQFLQVLTVKRSSSHFPPFSYNHSPIS